MKQNLNRMRLKRIVGFAGLLALAIGNRHALAGGGAHDGGRHPFQGFHRALASLDLTEAQRDQVKALAEVQKSALLPLHEQMKSDRMALRVAVEAPNPEPAAVGAAFLKVHANREATKARMEEFRGKLTPILTPQQNARLDGFLSALRPMHGPMRERGMHRGFDGPDDRNHGTFR